MTTLAAAPSAPGWFKVTMVVFVALCIVTGLTIGLVQKRKRRR